MSVEALKQDSKRPYEYVAFIIFAVMFLQQVILVLIRTIQFFTAPGVAWFNTAGLTTPGVFNRLIAMDNGSAFYVIVAVLGLAAYYVLIYFLVYNYCAKKEYSKWTWTLLIVFGGNILLTPVYYFYAAFVFRPHLMKFVHTMKDEFLAKKDAE